uniref:Ubiquitin-like protease family profile domain-containing protein n=1 Tax=Brassica oleracea var. oleracea TaxID=109376 RepID=A0A0D3CFQ8_BRAOL
MGILVTWFGFWASNGLEICLAHVLASLSIDTNAFLSIDSPSSPRQLPLARQTDHSSLWLKVGKIHGPSLSSSCGPEVKPPELSGEPSVLVFDKQVPTASDLQQGVTRRQTKKDVAMVCVCGKSEQARKLAASHQSPFKGNNTAKLIIPNKKFGQSYDPFVPVDKKMSKELTEWVTCDLNEHWISISISIPKKHIVVWDSIHSHISPEELDVFSNKNVKAMREKMGLDIFKETPGCHSKENEDNDENIATYDEEG